MRIINAMLVIFADVTAERFRRDDYLRRAREEDAPPPEGTTRTGVLGRALAALPRLFARSSGIVH